MEDNIKQLKEDYKIALKRSNTKEEKQHIKKDYKKMKSLIKNSNKLLKESEEEQKKWDKVWDKFDKEYQNLEQAKGGAKTIIKKRKWFDIYMRKILCSIV